MIQLDKVFLACCGATALLSLFPWYSVSISGEAGELLAAMQAGLPRINAFDRVWGVLAFLGALSAGALHYADRAGKLTWEPKTRRMAPFVAAAVSAVCVLLFMTGMGNGGMPSVMGMSAGMTFWYYLALLAMIVAAVRAFSQTQGPAAAPPAPEPGADR